MKYRFVRLLVLVLLPAVQSVPAAEPSYRLEGGGSVTVDPDTKRATVTRDGVSTPLYDGAHRTEDGNVLIIRRGITTIPGYIPPPPPAPKEVPAEQWEGAPIVGYSPCEKLVRRTCGRRNQCADYEGCELARQLLEMENEERDAAASRSRMTFTSGQCIEATPDIEVFTLCDRR